MGRYSDVLTFLGKVEDPGEKRSNAREKMTARKIQELISKYPGLPEDYTDYLFEVGWGSFRESQYMVYSEPMTPQSILDDETAGTIEKRMLCFGDGFSGDLSAFLQDEQWRVVEFLHETREIHETGMCFGSYIRKKMLMDPNGNDLRNS